MTESKSNTLFGEHMTFTLKNKDGEKVERSIKDFQNFWKIIVENYPGLFVPNFPEKKFWVSSK